MAKLRVKLPARTQVVSAAAFGVFAVVMLAIEALAFRGQLDFARYVMGLTDRYVYVVPVALEGGTLVTALLALRATLTHDPSFMHRVWTWILLGAAAAANWAGALAAGRDHMAALYLAGFCVVALRMWHAFLHGIQRSELRTAGALESPLPRFRPLRWLVAPRETFKAWKIAVIADVTSPLEALALARREIEAVTPEAPRAVAAAVDLASMTKKAATIHASEQLGTFEIKPVREWLAKHNVPTDYSTTSKTLRELREARQHVALRAVGEA